jgi:hypothetical protein
MKRNINLMELSKDHHQVLLLIWKIKQGINNQTPVNKIVDYMVHFSKAALKPYFKEEENDVLIFLNDDDQLKKRTLLEHQEILKKVEGLIG